MSTTDRPKDAIRDASTVVILRDDGPDPRVLMGQRGQKAAFMPSKFVFPGGAVDAEDMDIPFDTDIPDHQAALLARRADPALVRPLLSAAVREVWEETGLALATGGHPPVTDVPEDWRGFFAAGLRPAPEHLTFMFRAITPPGRPRRFDARFFLVSADAVLGDLDDFSRASDELSHLSWLTLAEARRLDLPFITEVVLAEIEARLSAPDAVRPVP
ncbi:MAG: NUDIX hydrolase, partial [Pseudomonadota bacterium]